MFKVEKTPTDPVRLKSPVVSGQQANVQQGTNASGSQGNNAAARPVPRGDQGLVGALLNWISGARAWRLHVSPAKRQIHLEETLAIGGRRQLMLVRCGSERFLIAAGPESVSSMIRLESAGSTGSTAQATSLAALPVAVPPVEEMVAPWH